MKKFNIPNIITIARIFLLPLILYGLFNDKKLLVICLLIIAGLSDAVDGFFARKFKESSEFGAMLDSFSDYLYYAVFAFWFVVKYLVVLNKYFYAMAIPVLFVLSAYLIMFLRFKKVFFLHLYTSKFTAIVSYVLFLATLTFRFNSVFFELSLWIWFFSSFEILLVSVLINKPRSDVGSVVLLK